MLMVLDNYDSFTWNLVQYLGELGADPMVVRNDRITVAEAVDRKPRAIVISPGPGTPADAGISVPLVRAAQECRIPLLGVCLGHQAIGEAFGGTVIRAERLMHGKATDVAHGDDPLFASIPSPMPAMRYHSLIVRAADLPQVLRPIAWSNDRARGAEIMAMRHVDAPIWGVQFHPESVGTAAGRTLLTNFLRIAEAGA